MSWLSRPDAHVELTDESSLQTEVSDSRWWSVVKKQNQKKMKATPRIYVYKHTAADNTAPFQLLIHI